MTILNGFGSPRGDLERGRRLNNPLPQPEPPPPQQQQRRRQGEEEEEEEDPFDIATTKNASLESLKRWRVRNFVYAADCYCISINADLNLLCTMWLRELGLERVMRDWGSGFIAFDNVEAF